MIKNLHFGPRDFLQDMQQEIESKPYLRIDLRPLAPTIGAEIFGQD